MTRDMSADASVSLYREADQRAAEQREQVHDAVQAAAALAGVQRVGPQAAAQKVSGRFHHSSAQAVFRPKTVIMNALIITSIAGSCL